jgi:hypothetical protein
MISLQKSKALLVHLFLSSHLLTFLSKYILSDPGIGVLIWSEVGDRFESWDCLSFSFAHHLEDHCSHVIEKTSLVCLSFLFPLKDWFGFCLFLIC